MILVQHLQGECWFGSVVVWWSIELRVDEKNDEQTAVTATAARVNAERRSTSEASTSDSAMREDTWTTTR